MKRQEGFAVKSEENRSSIAQSEAKAGTITSRTSRFKRKEEEEEITPALYTHFSRALVM